MVCRQQLGEVPGQAPRRRATPSADSVGQGPAAFAEFLGRPLRVWINRVGPPASLWHLSSSLRLAAGGQETRL